MPVRPPYFSVALISATALAYEVLLMRLFSVIQWHHFSYMIIGLALLGYGMSGSLVSIFQHWLLRRSRLIYQACLLLFGITSVASFMLAQAIPFNAEMVLWDFHQVGFLLLIFLLLSLPFLFAASAICIAFMVYRGQVARIYAWDLAGAGVGSLAVIGLLFLAFPENILVVIGAMSLTSVLVASWEFGAGVSRKLYSVLLASLFFLVLAALNLELKQSSYKSLPQTLLINGTEVIEQDSSPFGVISIVDSTVVPFRHAPGLSLSSTAEPLPQLGVFTDGDNMTVITKAADNNQQLAYLDQVTSALPYHLRTPDSVLIVGAGGGADILQALYHATEQGNEMKIDAVELNAQLLDIVGHRFSDFNGGLYQRPDVQLYAADVRGFLSSKQKNYDLIQLSLMDAFNASASGLYALNEDYLYTIEALQLYLQRLNPDGYLSLTRWIKMPPRDTLKLFATAVDALRMNGVEDPAAHLLLIRGWQTATLLIKNGMVTDAEREKVSQFSDARSFDIAFAAGSPLSADSYNKLAQSFFKEGAAALLSERRQQYIDSYKFDLEPATDDRPYFHHFTKWSSLPEIFTLRNRGGMPLIEWGYVVLVTTLVIAAVLSVILIALPLLALPRTATTEKNSVSKLRVILYFLAIGLAFLFMEIALMQKFILFLHHPVYSFATTLSAFLVFAGLGSSLSSRWSWSAGRRTVLFWSITGIVLFGILYTLFLDSIFGWLSASPLSIRILLCIVLVAPLAVLMGMPFPLALSSLSEHAQHLVPWAWAINGCASVISASSATLLAIHIGFNAVIVIAVLLYASISFLYPKPRQT